jgi:hypothetical protein
MTGPPGITGRPGITKDLYKYMYCNDCNTKILSEETYNCNTCLCLRCQNCVIKNVYSDEIKKCKKKK